MGVPGPLCTAVLSAGGGGSWCLPRQLLQHECPRCSDLPPFVLFGDLEQHMRKQHELFCCRLCLKHLKVRLPCARRRGHRWGTQPGSSRGLVAASDPGRLDPRILTPPAPLPHSPGWHSAGREAPSAHLSLPGSWCLGPWGEAGDSRATPVVGPGKGRWPGSPALCPPLLPTDLHVRAQVVLTQGPGAAPHAGGPG